MNTKDNNIKPTAGKIGNYLFVCLILICGLLFFLNNGAKAESETNTKTIEITNSENKTVNILVQHFYIEQEEVLSPDIISGKDVKEIVIPKINPKHDGVFFQFDKQVVNIITSDTNSLLDILFTDREGKITSILKNIKADSSEKIPSCSRISAVIALKSSVLDGKNIQIGDRIGGNYFVTDCSFEECTDYESWQKKNPPPPQNIEECTNNLKLKYLNAKAQNK